VFIDGKSEHATKTRKDALVVRGGTLFNGQTTIANGAVSIEGDVIRAAGPDASGPLNAEIVEFPAGSWIVPGFIDLGTTLGLGGNPTPVGMNVKLGERLLGTDKAIALAREGGVTTALLAGGDGPAPVVAFKLSDSARAVRDPVAIRMTVRDGSAGSVAGLKSALQSGKTYAESWTKFDAAQIEYEKLKKEYDAAKAKADAAKKPEEKKPDAPASGSGSAPKDAPKEAPKKSFEDDEPSQATEKKEEAKPADAKTATPAAPTVPPEPKAPTKPSVVETLEPYRALFAGKLALMIEARRLDAIRTALAVAKDEFKLNPIILGADDAFRKPDLLAAGPTPTVVGPMMVREIDREIVNLPQILAGRGVPLGFQSQAGTGVKFLPEAVRYSVRYGLGVEEALKALTSGPAKFLGIDDRVGSLTPGRDADLTVLSGPPFLASTKVLAVLADGKWVFRAGAEKR
ncbi:MAG TPA: amidohydrolase family protein, partial [Planctomycetia bacterium]|nr:amidohydrolase family protein [Planctomycetia bacterium]